MTTGRTGIARTVVAYVVIIIVVMAGTGVALFTSQRAVVTPSTGYSTPSSVSADGLRLMLNLSQPSIVEGSGVSFEASIYNNLSMRISIAPSNNMSLDLGPCRQSPLGVGIAKGNYDAGNLSKATFLNLYEPGPHFCQAIFSVSAWSFAPMSDDVTLLSPQPVGPGNATVAESMWTAPAGANLYYSGYWTGVQSLTSGNASFSSFSPGTYTLAAEDEWGQVAVLHFQDLPLTCAMAASDPSSFVAYTNYSSSSSASGPLQLQAYYREAGTNNTYLLAVSPAGSVSSTLASVHYEGPYYVWYLQYSPNFGESQSWQYIAPNGTLVYPAIIAQNQCSIVRVVLPQVSAEVPLILLMSNNETQTFTLNP